LGKCLTALRAPHPSRLYTSQRMATCEFLGSQRVLLRPSGLLGSSSLRQLRLVGPRSLAQARSVAPSRQPAARSASPSRLPFRRTLRGLFRTNPAALGGSGSSGLINLLVFHLAATVVSRRPFLPNQGPLRASNAVSEPNYFLLQPTSFHHPTRLMGSGGYTVRGLMGESALFVSELRPEDFRAFFVAIARLLRNRASQGDSAIRRPNVSPPAETTDRRYAWAYDPENTRCGPVRRALRYWILQPALNFSSFPPRGF
jgi:hypothetical protein